MPSIWLRATGPILHPWTVLPDFVGRTQPALGFLSLRHKQPSSSWRPRHVPRRNCLGSAGALVTPAHLTHTAGYKPSDRGTDDDWGAAQSRSLNLFGICDVYQHGWQSSVHILWLGESPVGALPFATLHLGVWVPTWLFLFLFSFLSTCWLCHRSFAHLLIVHSQFRTPY